MFLSFKAMFRGHRCDPLLLNYGLSSNNSEPERPEVYPNKAALRRSRPDSSPTADATIVSGGSETLFGSASNRRASR